MLESYQDVETKYFLSKYLINYEAYDWQTIQEQADTVKTMSSQKVFSAYDTMIRADSSPLNILKNNYKIKVQINSVILLRKDMAQVRFKKWYWIYLVNPPRIQSNRVDFDDFF